MKAIIIEKLGGPENLVIQNLPDPEPETPYTPRRVSTRGFLDSASPMPPLSPVTGPVPYRERGFMFRFSIGRTF
jgi:hypothetical protein